MHPAQILAVKREILRSSIPDLEVLAQRILKTHDPDRTQQLLARLNA
jgi:phosphotransferase system enzyme I (PtsI)